jgi:hypothetical protein
VKRHIGIMDTEGKVIGLKFLPEIVRNGGNWDSEKK